MFKDKYRNDNENIKPSKEILAELTNKMEAFTEDDKIETAAHKHRMQNSISYRSLLIPACIVCIVLISYTAISDKGIFNNWFSSYNRDINYDMAENEINIASQDMEDTTDESIKEFNEAEKSIESQADSINPNYADDIQDSSQSYESILSFMEDTSEPSINSSRYQSYQDSVKGLDNYNELPVDDKLLNLLKNAKSSISYPLRDNSYHDIEQAEGLYSVILYTDYYNTELIIYPNGIIYEVGSLHYYKSNQELMNTFINSIQQIN